MVEVIASEELEIIAATDGEAVFGAVGLGKGAGELGGLLFIPFNLDSSDFAIFFDEIIHLLLVFGAPEINIVGRKAFFELGDDIVFEEMANIGAQIYGAEI